MKLLSYGGGTQSAALALMSAAGDLPRLDAVIFADTHGELPETYSYAEYVADQLRGAGIPFVRVSAGSLESALLASEPTAHNPTPPAHVANPDGSRGRINRYRCSYDYKRRVITQETKRRLGGRGAWKRGPTVEQWIGFSADEVTRCKPDLGCRCGHNRTRPNYPDGRARGHQPGCTDCDCPEFSPWRVNRWPLIELRYARADTIRWFGEHGHPTPPRSACWFCPNSGDGRWRALQAEHPDLFERACRIDDHIRHGAGFNARGNQPFAGEMFLHGARIPLRQVDLRTAGEQAAAAGQDGLFDEAELLHACRSGVCFT